MARGDIQVENLGSLNHKLAEMRQLDREVRQGLKKGTEIIRTDAVFRCPTNHGELRGSIHTKVVKTADGYQGIVFTNKDYAGYVEMGTGPVGAANHAGISPHVNPTYRGDSWWFPGDQVDPADADKYHWPRYTNSEGKTFYLTSGQPAQPFMYPAMKSKESAAVEAIQKEVHVKVKKLSKMKGN